MISQASTRRTEREARILSVATMLALGACALSACAPRGTETEHLEIGLTTSGALIDGLRVSAGVAGAPTVALVGGLAGDDASSDSVTAAVEAYAARPDADRFFNLLAVPVANPERSELQFPPTGPAYRENAESHALWRWLGLNGPDFVFVVGEDGARLAARLQNFEGAVAGVGLIPSGNLTASADVLMAIPTTIPHSPARLELERRRSLSPSEYAALLAPIYGQSFDPPIYIDGMALIAHLGLGDVAHVETLVAQYVDGSRDSLESRFGVSTLVLAGHLVFAELAERTSDVRYLERARAAADFAFTDDGEMLEAMPGHGEMSDAIFMGASILAAVGDLTGEQRYFDMAVRQVDFMNKLVRRDDGLYRHSPLTEAAWGRGNGFAAIGYALTLSKLPEDHPDFGRLLGEYRDYMATLAGWQNVDGTWRQVIDHPGAYHETSSTAIIGFSMQRGLNRGWLDASIEPVVERAFQGLLSRTDANGGFIDVSESTNKQPTDRDYLLREALFGRDSRTGSFAMLFAVERDAAARQ